jgi:hypothetical protein
VVNRVSTSRTVPGQILYIPLEFWFNRNPGLALPLIALQYHEVKINIELAKATDLFWSQRDSNAGSGAAAWVNDQSSAAVTVPSLASCSLYVDYVYLDTDERRRFAQAAHEYLIEQLQFTGAESTSQVNNKIKLNFNHPTKALVWVVQPNENLTQSAPQGPQWFNYTDGQDLSYDSTFIWGTTGVDIVSPGTSTTAGGLPGVAAGGANGVYIPISFDGGANPVAQALLQLNGHDRFSVRDGRYFNLVQPYQHFENVPKQGINVYSFALKPEEHQPSGTCNFSRIDSANLNLTLTPATVAGGRSAEIRVYAINYNVLRIMSGMGGLMWAN